MLSFKRIWEFLSLTHYETEFFVAEQAEIFSITTGGEMKSGSSESNVALIVKFIPTN